MEDFDVRQTDPQMLAKMMDLGSDDQKLWEPEELGEIFEHQLSAPLGFDLLGLDERSVQKLRSQWAADPPMETFRDLLHHPCPPVEALDLTKRFAKAHRGDRESPLPDEVVSVLYILSIVVAMSKCGRRITQLSDEKLQFGVAWALKQSWLDESTRNLLEEGRKAIQSKP